MNKNVIINGIVGVVGVAIGGITGYSIATKKAEKQRANDLQETREYYKKRYGTGRYPAATEEPNTDEDEEEEEPAVEESLAYPISPNDFDELEGYTTICLNLYTDGYLVTSSGEVLDESAESLIGKENMRKFGMYEPDTLHLRDDSVKRDYEIILQDEKYIDE